MLGRNRAARACIDLSDGLADGVRQIGEASGLGAIVDADALPIEEGSTLSEALSGGDDYELLFAASPRMRGRKTSSASPVPNVPNNSCLKFCTTDDGKSRSDRGKPRSERAQQFLSKILHH